jgi:hypothetical protein
MAVPRLEQSFTWPADPEFSPPGGWEAELSGAAFLVGTAGFVLVLILLLSDRSRATRRGRRVAWANGLGRGLRWVRVALPVLRACRERPMSGRVWGASGW